MKKEDLKRAKQLEQEISELDSFIQDCKKCWHILRLKRIRRFEMKTSYGAINNSLEPERELAQRILSVIENYKEELERELERM